MKVVIDVKAINVGRYKNGDSKKQKKFDYYRCYVSIFN